MMEDREDEVQALIAHARDALVAAWGHVHWTYWVRLGWRADWIDAATANDHLEKLVGDLDTANVCGGPYPTMRLLAGFHSDPYPHAHAAVSLSRLRRVQFLNADEFRDWLRRFYWHRGPVWVQDFDPTRTSPEHGGAVEYLSRDPGSVVWG